ncbi:transcription factor Ouib isoform X1 [Drosophila elegans]|uniref:transcription factor Ouib isoform X1 n=2 Tax=Drosophila elegans TaxID=30023 RepID=UPI0007E8AD75|nr:transcription factor Ouib isoform X1 [Drosophila elegans]
MSELRSVCRTCGKNVESSVATKLFQKSNYHLISLVENITDMFLELDSYMPVLICNSCKLQLDRISTFRSRCLEVHQSFLAIKKKFLQRKAVTVEELQEGTLLRELKEKENHLEYLENYVEEEDLLEDQEDAAQEEEYQEENIQKVTEQQKEENLEEQVQEEEEDLVNFNQIPRIRKRTTANRSRRERRNAKTWICDQCGGVFKCSTYLKLHMQRHTGHKPFECDICQAKYYTENEMRRHRILHSDARPYACRFCGKTFRGCSSKVVHERTHTNERPFQCQHCDKAFTSTSTRQRHEMLHTNQRKYHCETCDQWFLRLAHLTLHQKTILHQRRVESASTIPK